MPRPTRFLECFCPTGGFRSLRFIVARSPLVDHRKQMRNFFDHAAEPGRIRPHHHLVDLAQSQAAHDHLVLLRRTDGAAHQLDLDCGFHDVYCTFSGVRPRISSMTFLSRNCSSATTVMLEMRGLTPEKVQ